MTTKQLQSLLSKRYNLSASAAASTAAMLATNELKRYKYMTTGQVNVVLSELERLGTLEPSEGAET